MDVTIKQRRLFSQEKYPSFSMKQHPNQDITMSASIAGHAASKTITICFYYAIPSLGWITWSSDKGWTVLRDRINLSWASPCSNSFSLFCHYMNSCICAVWNGSRYTVKSAWQLHHNHLHAIASNHFDKSRAPLFVTITLPDLPTEY